MLTKTVSCRFGETYSRLPLAGSVDLRLRTLKLPYYSKYSLGANVLVSGPLKIARMAASGKSMFWRGKFRHVSSSSEEEDDADAPPPNLTGDPITESILTVGCLMLSAAITLGVMAVVIQGMKLLS